MVLGRSVVLADVYERLGVAVGASWSEMIDEAREIMIEVG